MKYTFPLLLLYLLASCTTTKDDNAIYFGGKIINPKSDFVVLYNHLGALDSIKLKEDNTFLRKFDSIQEGLYYFKHGPEHQYIYLEPKDSLLLRLNTWYFDESLVFSCTNAEKNNLLIQSFLTSEKERKHFQQLFKLNPAEFEIKIDSIEKEKIQQIEIYKAQNPEVSNKFITLLTIANTYPLYANLENYSIQNKRKTASNTFLKTTSSFYKHRNNIDLNLDSIIFFQPYSNYVINRLYNDTYQKGVEKKSDEFTVALLNTIDKNITSEKLKNAFLKEVTIYHFYNKSSSSLNKEAFYTFFKLNTDIEDKKHVQRLLNDAKKLTKGKKVPNFSVTDYNGTQQSIHTIIKKKNSVIYFRNTQHTVEESIASRIQFLSKKHPNTLFIIVNMIDKNINYIKNLDIKNQYYLPTNSTANHFLTSKYSRAIIVNKNNVIQNGFSNLSSFKVSKQLEELQK